MRRPIAISLSPNMEKDDVLLAVKILFSPINWFNFRNTEKLESEFASYFGPSFHALALNSGRSAEYLILKTLGIKAGDEVVIQALTCVAVPNSVLWLGARPIYVDVDNTLNMDFKDLHEKISENTRAVIVQNSFGVPAKIDKIQKAVGQKRREIVIIEDCALSLGATYKGKKVGTLGKVAFFSLGRDKVISSIFGGIILTKDKNLYEKLKIERDELLYPSPFWVVQQLFHPIVFSAALPLYNFGVGKFTLGKLIIFIFQKLRLISKAIYEEEKLGIKPRQFPAKLPGGLSTLALNQFAKLLRFNKKRLSIADYYFRNLKTELVKLPNKTSGAIWVRFPLITKKAKKIIDYAKKQKVLLGDWYKDVVVPVNDLSLAEYVKGSCPNAERLSGNILNLPTYPTMHLKDKDKVIQLIKQCLTK